MKYPKAIIIDRKNKYLTQIFTLDVLKKLEKQIKKASKLLSKKDMPKMRHE